MLGHFVFPLDLCPPHSPRSHELTLETKIMLFIPISKHSCSITSLCSEAVVSLSHQRAISPEKWPTPQVILSSSSLPLFCHLLKILSLPLTTLFCASLLQSCFLPSLLSFLHFSSRGLLPFLFLQFCSFSHSHFSLVVPKVLSLYSC